MIIVDTALAKRAADQNPIRVGLIGAGYMGSGIVTQIERYINGMRVAAVSNRTVAKAEKALRDAGVETVEQVHTAAQMADALARGSAAVTDQPSLVCGADGIDAVIECTGEVELGAQVSLAALASRKHLVLMNAELDATVGPILKVYAERAGVVITNTDGDQPGVMMNLLRFVRSIGYRPVLAGNIKGLQDYYRTPETQRGFAEKHHLTPKMATSFADGTKMSMENAIVANATGFGVGRRGMFGPRCRHANEAVSLFPADRMLAGGMVDYILGAEPGPGVFVIGYNDDPVRGDYMRYFKMGDGPFYVFYVPYHLPHLEVPLTVARAVIFGDAAVRPIGGPVCDVMAVAKKDLRAGDVLDGIGGFACYGLIENYSVSSAEGFLPMGLSEGCTVQRTIRKDEPLLLRDVKLPGKRLCDQLRGEQNAYFNSRAAV